MRVEAVKRKGIMGEDKAPLKFEDIIKYMKSGNRNVNYQIIDDKNKTGLQARVNDLMLTGWKPLGGVAVILERSPPYNSMQHWMYYQAMIKRRNIWQRFKQLIS